MKISIIVEGRTEKAFIPYLREYLKSRLVGNMPKLDPLTYDGTIYKGSKLRSVVANLLSGPLDRKSVV